MKKALIIGAGGFVGSYLAECLQNEFGMEVHATKLPGTQTQEDLLFLGDRVYELDILNKNDIVELLFAVRPDYIYHLAAQSSVSIAWKEPALTIDVNIKGSVNLMDAVRELYYKPRILLIGSGEEYGHILDGETPINEDTKLRPGNIYAATKVCQNMIGTIYSKAYDMELMLIRAFNHVGPKQSPIFVVSDFCKQVAEIEKGIRKPVMYVGNLAARRDFDMQRYENAFANHHVDIEFYTARKRPDDEVFPWEHLDVGVSRGFLLQEWHKAQEGKTTGNCRMQCSGCGSATYGGGVCFEAKN